MGAGKAEGPGVSSSKGDECPGCQRNRKAAPDQTRGAGWQYQFTKASRGILQDKGKLARWQKHIPTLHVQRPEGKHMHILGTPGEQS